MEYKDVFKNPNPSFNRELNSMSCSIHGTGYLYQTGGLNGGSYACSKCMEKQTTNKEAHEGVL